MEENYFNISNINNNTLHSNYNEVIRRINNDSNSVQIPPFYLAGDEMRFNYSPNSISNHDNNNYISIFRRRNWNILNSSEEEEEVNNLPNLDGDSPGYSPAVDYSNLTPYTRLLNHNETRFGIFDEGCSLIGRSHKEKYGKLTIFTIKKLMKNKLLNIRTINDLIYQKIVSIFFNNFEANSLVKTTFFMRSANCNNHVKIKKIISCFPSFKSLLRRINSLDFNDERNKNEILFIKICLDLQHRYYIQYDYPLFKNYIKKNLNVIIKFYQVINQQNLNYINNKLSIPSFKRLNLSIFSSVEDYLNISNNEKNDYMRITGGLELNKFIN